MPGREHGRSRNNGVCSTRRRKRDDVDGRLKRTPCWDVKDVPTVSYRLRMDVLTVRRSHPTTTAHLPTTCHYTPTCRRWAGIPHGRREGRREEGKDAHLHCCGTSPCLPLLPSSTLLHYLASRACHIWDSGGQYNMLARVAWHGDAA